MSTPITRRSFLTAATSTGAAAVLGGASLARAASAPVASAATQAAGANERLSIGLIGLGVRMSTHLPEIQKLAAEKNVEITALCDVWKVALNQRAEQVKKVSGKAPRTFTRFQDLLALKDVDAVVVATPDFSHMPIALAALRAGKDVYCEKPMSLSMAEANEALDIVRSKGRVVQVGTQHRSEGLYRAAAREIATGELGKITRINVSVNVNAPRWDRPFDDMKEADVDWDAYLLDLPKRPFDARRLRCWQLYKGCTNGMPGLWMTHYADAVNLLAGTKYPRGAIGLGGIYHWKDREHPDTFAALVDYPEGFLFNWGMGLCNASGDLFTVHGTNGTLDVNKLTVTPEDTKDKKLEVRKLEREPNESHMGNWLDCLRTRKRPNADIDCGHQHAVTTIMCAEAFDSGRRQTYDAAKREIRPA
jgi:predicted dehydrogenase